jgi:hypothetical protein
MFLPKMLRYFILQFLDSRGIGVGETPNDMCDHTGFNNETTFTQCDTTVQSGKILHAWIVPLTMAKIFQKSANKVIRLN